MKYNKEVFLNTFILIFIFSCLFAVPSAVKSQEVVGVILIAHGATDSTDPGWNEQVLNFYNNRIAPDDSDIRPSGLAFLRFDDTRILEDVIDNMREDHSNIGRILFVHLSPSSHSVRHEEIVERVGEHLPAGVEYEVVAMNTHPTVVEILKDHANSPPNVSLILVGYGATNELLNDRWNDQLGTIVRQIARDLNFNRFRHMTFRYHAADQLRARQVERFRELVIRLADRGNVRVVSYVLCQGNFQADLLRYVEGIDNVDICPNGVISHDNMELWVEDVYNDFRSRKAIPEVEPVNRTWSAMDAEVGGNKKHEYGNVKEKVITTTPK